MTEDEQLADLAGQVLAHLLVDLADSVEDLNDNLRANRAVIDWIGQVRPAIWEQLKARTQARRVALAANALDSIGNCARSMTLRQDNC